MRERRLRPVQLLVAVLVAAFMACAIALFDRPEILAWLLPVPSAYPDVPPAELERRMAAIFGALDEHGEQASPWPFRIDGCQIVLTQGHDRRACDDPDRNSWLREQSYDLRLLEAAPHSVDIRSVSLRGVDTDSLLIPVNDEAARRIEGASRRWGEFVTRLVRSAPGDGSDLSGRMDRRKNRAGRSTVGAVHQNDALLRLGRRDGSSGCLVRHRHALRGSGPGRRVRRTAPRLQDRTLPS